MISALKLTAADNCGGLRKSGCERAGGHSAAAVISFKGRRLRRMPFNLIRSHGAKRPRGSAELIGSGNTASPVRRAVVHLERQPGREGRAE